MYRIGLTLSLEIVQSAQAVSVHSELAQLLKYGVVRPCSCESADPRDHLQHFPEVHGVTILDLKGLPVHILGVFGVGTPLFLSVCQCLME